MTSVDCLLLDAKHAILDEHHRKFQTLHDEGRLDEAMKQFQGANRLPTTGLPSAHTLKRLGVAKRSNDGYAVPIKSVSEGEKKQQ